jgi:prepilin-type N-terminal cleavage/methylation domain-containing protein
MLWRRACYNDLHKAVSRVRRGPGFTLPELLVVLTIVAVLSALLFPVFRSVRATAYRTTCASNFYQAQLAATLYLNDYDGRYMPVNHYPGEPPDPNRDRTWVQLLLPYTSSFGIFRCPSDRIPRPSEAVFEEGVFLGDPAVRFYNASLRVNIGYNYLHYSPVYWDGSNWVVRTRSEDENVDSTAILFVDSVYDVKGGQPTGGGSYIVVPPCRYALRNGRVVDVFSGVPPKSEVFAPTMGWDIRNESSPFRYGFAWPWHDGRINIARAGGGSVAVTPLQLSFGCQVKRKWQGFIVDDGKYLWNGGD